jgi:hypothetical protein
MVHHYGPPRPIARLNVINSYEELEF